MFPGEYARHGFEVPYRDDDREVLAASPGDFVSLLYHSTRAPQKRMGQVSLIRTFFARRLIRI